MVYLGDFAVGATVQLKWASNGANGASITRATNGSLRIYKGSSVTQRTSSAGITDTEDFDSLTGVHHATIDLADNTDAGFYAAGSEYQVVLQGATIDGQSVNAVLAHFSIERYGNVYGARVWMIDDNAAGTPADRYVVAFMKNGQALTTGITSPQIRVVLASDGSDLFTGQTLTDFGGSIGYYRFDATGGNRSVSGSAYLAIITATIDGATRTIVQPVGRDS